jgi:hypothetical protein
MSLRKLSWTALAIVACIAASGGVIDGISAEQADKALKRALVTFAVARTLNGVISVAQGTEVAVEPAGVGVTMTVGEVLDPVNDLVERFSGVMLVAASSIGLQILLLNITGWWGVTALLVLSALAALAALWWPGALTDKRRALALQVFLIALLVRFAVPAVILATNLVFDVFLEPQQAAATAALESTQSEIEQLNEEQATEPAGDQSWMERLGSAIDESLQSMQVTERLSRLKDSASDASEHIVSLIAIFVLQTIILPVAFVWLLVEMLKGVAARMLKP